ncbi:MAG: hypothetical protein HY303_18670 [Candidatus Wallbacteria bacterium]|nr:hypothetical protein [Candidatus Wallbacteria bacterium]
MDGYDLLKFLHMLAVVFMAAPLYNLIVVNERAKLGNAHVQVDRYMENLLRGAAVRCFVFQATALITGIALVGLRYSLVSLADNRVLLAKMLLLIALSAMLSVVAFSLQPRIDRLLAQVAGDSIPTELAARLGPLRLQRKRMAAGCLFLVLTTVLLGLQIVTSFASATNAALLVLAGAFSWRVYARGIPFGWV